MTAPPACVFPPCPVFGVALGAAGRRFCERCGRPLGGPGFGPAPGYRLMAWLGSGYYADVFRAVDLGSGTLYAAKLYADDPPKRQASLRECDALQRLSHARLPVFKAAFDDGGWRFVIMELVAGINLRQRVETSGPLPADRVIALAIEACEVFEYLASHGWTYRDLHPKNIHLDTPKGVMLVDLDGARPLNAPSQMAGRIGYRAPELEQGKPVSPACDVYSLAGCVFFALTGDDPPEHPGPLPALRDLVSACLPLVDLLDACRRADPAQRPGVDTLRAPLLLLALA